MHRVLLVLLVCQAVQAFSFFGMFGRDAPHRVADVKDENDAVAVWAMNDAEGREEEGDVAAASIPAVAVVTRVLERNSESDVALTRGAQCMREAAMKKFSHPCDSSSEDEMRAFAVVIANCHLSASGRRTYQDSKDMDEVAFNAYTLFYSKAREACVEIQADAVASLQRRAARELAVVAQQTATDVRDLGRSVTTVAKSVKLQEDASRAGLEMLRGITDAATLLNRRTSEMSESLQGLSTQSQEAALRAKEGFEMLASQGEEAIKENREGFASVSEQAEKLGRNMNELFERAESQLETVAKGSAEASAKTAELALQLAQAHDVQCQLLKAQQVQLELTKTIGKSVDTAFGSAAGLVVVAWYTATSVIVVVATSFSMTSQSRPLALAVLVFTGLCEYAAYTGMSAAAIAGSELAEKIVHCIRLIGSSLSVASVLAATAYRFTSGKPMIDQEEERFMRYIIKYMAKDRV